MPARAGVCGRHDMPKDILLFLDGTRNRGDHRATSTDTNVWRLYDAVLGKNLPGGPTARYVRGVAGSGAPAVGSDASPMASGATRLARVDVTVRRLIERGRYFRNDLESATGWGLALQIQRAYAYLCQHYEHGDRVSLFGFSRGAFAARSLAGFTDQVGLLLSDAARSKRGRHLVTLAYELYRTGRPGHWEALRRLLRQMSGASMPVAAEGQASTVLPVYFIGVWDTVDALGLEALGLNNRRVPIVRRHTRHHVADVVPTNVTHARHAISLHDVRDAFEPVLWKEARSTQVLEQPWFAGAHADVGGGYADASHSVLALDWMAREFLAALRKAGSPLRLAPLPTPAAAWAGMAPHHEMRGVFTKRPATVRAALAQFAKLPAATRATFSVHRSAAARLLDPAAIDYSVYPYASPSSGPVDFPENVERAFRKVDDLTVQLHLARCLSTGAAGGPMRAVTPAVAADLATHPPQWSTAKTRFALRNAQRLVDATLPSMHWDAAAGARLADAIVLLLVFCRGDLLEPALQRIDARAAAWAKLLKHPQRRKRRLWHLAGSRSALLHDLFARADALLPAAACTLPDSVRPLLETVRSAARAFPAVPKLMKPLKPLPGPNGHNP